MRLFDTIGIGIRLLILANILVPILLYLNNIEHFVLMSSAISERPWTIITSMFIHADNGHLLSNMLALLVFGAYLEKLIGEKSTLMIYFIGGIMGSVFVIFLDPSGSATVGASGAIFAIFGTLMVLKPKQTIYLFLAIPIILSLNPKVPWVNYIAGLVVGLIAGYILRRKVIPETDVVVIN